MKNIICNERISSSRLLLMVLLLILTNLVFVFNSNISLYPPLNNTEYNVPKTSAGEITITTPENITYYKPMEGYYPATYGFDNEFDGISGEVIEYVDNASISSSCEVKIYDEYQGHKKVLRIHDGNTLGNAGAQDNFLSTQTTGSVEWWWNPSTSGSNGIAYHFHEGIKAVHAGRVLIQDGDFKDMEDNIVQSYIVGQWYHHKLVFDTTSDTYDWYIDGILRVDDGDFLNPVNNIGCTEIKGGWNSIGSCYVDAVGYSWDTDYGVGDNSNEGLLLSYENTTRLAWTGYSLDDLTNKTIMGNTTLLMPDPGSHKIQLFGNTSLGTMYESSIRYFSVSLINLLTPENKTYSMPMNGYYPATNGFENVPLGGYSSNMNDNPSDPNCGAPIISEKDQHNKVVHVDDDSGSGRVRLNYNFTDRDFGTMEFWVMAEDASNPLVMSFNDDDVSGIRFRIELKFDKWYQYVGSTAILIPNFDGISDPQDNTWYHLTFHFRGAGAPSYQSLNENQYRVLIDGLDSGPLDFQIPGGSVERLRFFTGNAATSDFWLDAFGESWDSNYNVGDNQYEGLLLSYENTTTLDWQGYSLDGQTNKTIFGNTTVPMPDPGFHKIQVFGNNSLGTMYESSIRYFSVSAFNLITPENKTYIEPMNGYYPATYGFENDQVGSIPEGWTDESQHSSNFISVYDQKDQHYQVVRIYDANTATGGGADTTAQYNFQSPQVSGSIECWVYKESGSAALVIQGTDGSTTGFQISIDSVNDGSFRYAHAPSSYTEFANGKYADQEWFHLRINFNCDTDTADYYLNGIKEVEDGSFHLPVSQINYLLIRSGNSGHAGVMYFDAVSFSWDPYYNVGDNRFEGLLLGFDSSTSLDWLGYSLDNQTNRTVLGNTTLVLPNKGLHNIQLFANNTLGTMYESDLRYFTVDISEPTVSVITPTTNQYYGVDAPSFTIGAQGANLDKYWYSLDNGITNISFYLSSGDISQSEWDKYGHGPVQISFYVNDSFNRISYDLVTVNKDLNGPTTTIHFVPYSGANVVLTATLFSLIATDNSESGISTIRYRIDSSGWIPYAGAFSLSSHASGFHTITYQSIDAVGNVETENYLVIDLYIPSPPPDPPNLIPFIVIGVGVGLVALIGIGIFLYSRRRTPKTPIKARTDKKPHSGSEKLKVCPFCFAEIKINAKFCTSCGASVEKD